MSFRVTWSLIQCGLPAKFEYYLQLFFSANECKDSQPTFWKNNYLASYGDICENYVGPKKYCDIKWGEVCDGKKCGEFCKKTCNKC